MKNYVFPVLLACSLGALNAQTSVQWSDATVLTTTAQAITAPRIFALPDGALIATWGTSGGSSQIWLSRWENGAFGTPVGVLQDPYEPSLFGFGGYDVAIQGTKVHIVFEQLQAGILLASSHDGGHTFDTPVTVQGPVAGGYATLASIVLDGSGNPVVSYILDKNGAVYHVRRSVDGGQSFGNPVIANAPAPGGAFCECCTSDMVASGDSLWMVFRNNNQNLRDIWVSRSADLAASFTTATDVDDTDWILNACPISGPRMARSGDSLLMAWMSKASGNGRIYLSTLHAGSMQAGQQIGMPHIPGLLNTQSQADVTALGDTIGLVHVEKSREILFYHSTKGASDLTQHGQRFVEPNHALQYPAIAFQQGAFHLVYVDLATDQVLYRKGTLGQSSASVEPKKETISVFPNPVIAGKCWVNNSQGLLLGATMYDLFGSKVLEQKSTGHLLEITLDRLPPGIYWLEAVAENGESTRFKILHQ